MITFLKRLTNKNTQINQSVFRFCSTNPINSQVLGDYVIKSKMSGHSSENLYEKYKNFYNVQIEKINIPGTTIVKNRDQAHKVVKILKSLPNREHAWDTETVDVDAKLESPIGKGKIICASAFCGIDVDFGNGPRLFIDNFAQNIDLILIFKEYLEDTRYKKIWHNYGFDRHIFYNHGINVQGFGGDTMHMSRLADPSRGPKEYSLANVTKHYEEEIKYLKKQLLGDLRKSIQVNTKELQVVLTALQKGVDLPHEIIQKFQLHRFNTRDEQIFFINDQIQKWLIKKQPADQYEKYYLNTNLKTNMKQLFGKKKYLKDGKEGKTIEFPNTIRMHTDPELLEKWVHYSCLDAEITFFVFQVLKDELKSLSTNFEDMRNMLDLYNKYWKPFGEILTDLERRGFELNLEHLEKIRVQAENDMTKLEKQFLDWVCSTQQGLEQFNYSSTQQLQQLFFAPFKRKKRVTKEKVDANLDDKEKKDLEGFKNFEENNAIDDEEDLFRQQSFNELNEDFDEGNDEESSQKNKRFFKKAKPQEDDDDGYLSDGRKKSVRKEEDDIPQTKAFKVLNLKGFIPEGKKKPPKQLDMNITGLGLEVINLTDSGMPAADLPVLKILAGNPKKGNYGAIGEYYKQKGDEEMGKKASQAIESLIQLKQVETLLTTFIIPLRELADADGRIHCSLNMNTETGRISARKPNLMNQPSHDKDVYKIRSAFQAGKGKKLIVADYGQLELRILAHMTNCKAMIEAFKMGGDFHSRTAMGMYPKLKEEIDRGELLLEWDKSQGEPPAPLLKDKYSSERKKAKMMNFSIAYGKSAHGFSKDWNCSMKEAQEALDAWFADRKEVKEWQENTKKIALEHGYTQTMMGRYRNLERLTHSKSARHLVQHGLRASINTPIQGGAADLVIAAMVKVSNDVKLNELGYKLLLQIHDELILEGPEEHAQEALARVIEIMENPLDTPLLLKMEVDAKVGNNWYECK
ncbi:hypothetical protein ABPG72_012850 [Tetrahymena utriculariae]